MQPKFISSDPIPVKPYTRAFIEQGNLVKGYVMKSVYKLFTKETGAEKPVNLNAYTDRLKLQLPWRVFERQGFRLSGPAVLEFNELLEGYIKDRFECELEANIRAAIRTGERFIIQDMILELRQKFQLTEENFPLETIKKSLQRFCERENIDLEQIKIFVKCVPEKIKPIATKRHYMRSDKYMSLLRISKRTFSRWVKANTVYVQREGYWLHVDLTRSPLPLGYTLPAQ